MEKSRNTYEMPDEIDEKSFCTRIRGDKIKIGKEFVVFAEMVASGLKVMIEVFGIKIATRK